MSAPDESGEYPVVPSYPARAELRRLRAIALLLVIPGVVWCVLGAVFNPEQLLRSYLVAFVFWASIALGSLGIVMIQHVAPGAWGAVLRRPLEAASRTILPLAGLFVPILLGVSWLYPWARPGAAQHDELIAHKAPYLNVPFFALRSVLYFAAWSGLAYWLSRLSLARDTSLDLSLPSRLRKLSAVGLVVYCLTMTLASFDWLMSLDPHWYSTIYGVYVIGGQAVSAMAFGILVTAAIARRPPLSEVVRPQHFHDFGKMLLAFVMLWAYFGFSQLLIIWAGNLPEEIPFYLDRARGGFRYLSLALFVLHFALPFMLLLSRDLKRDARRLTAVAGLLLVMRWVDVYWLIAPAFSPGRLRFHWLDLAATAAVGGAWLLFFGRELRARPLLPLEEPLLNEVREHG